MMNNEVKKKLEERFDTFGHIDYVKTEIGDYHINNFDSKINFLVLWNQSEENMNNGKKGFVDYYDVDNKGKVFVSLNKDGQQYFSKFIVPLIIESANITAVERYDNKLIGEGQRNDFSENGPIRGVKHSPNIMEQNYFGAMASFVQKPGSDEFISGPRGETIDLDKKGNPTMDTYKFVTRHYNKN